MTTDRCPFCAPDAHRVFFESDLVIGLWDAFPVSDGHALLITRRHVDGWFETTDAERQALLGAVAAAYSAILARGLAPAGFNIGVNIGAAAGQTVPHVHVHVIPRYAYDVPDPRGGVRYVIPDKANYVAERATPAPVTGEARLVRGYGDPLFPHLVHELGRARWADFVVSFAMRSGVDRLFPHLADFLERGGRLRLLTGDYLDVTDPPALRRLLDLEGAVELRVFETAPTGHLPSQAFHPKAYIFIGEGDSGTAFVGSSNLSESALTDSVEWNYRVISSLDRGGFQHVREGFDGLFTDNRTRPLTIEWVESYEERRAARRPPSQQEVGELEKDAGVPMPNDVQLEALDALSATRERGNRAGLVVLATGLGKTWLSAFDSNTDAAFKKVLFVAHRDEILAQALATYRRIRPAARLGRFTGGAKDLGADVLFASVQTLSRREHITHFAPEAFDYIVVDEFHHASAATYRRIIEHFKPAFLLGLTATPERSDGGDLLTLCQQNLVFRCDLVQGVKRQLLSPFHYFGVPDEVDYSQVPWRSTRFDEEALTTAVATVKRAGNALDQYRKRAGSRTLGFCVSQRHADFMAAYFVQQGVRAVAVHSGPTSAPRAESLERLSQGDLDIVFAVDMFNEGVDLPSLDTVMMLRPTESKVLWLQQFGRGLRRSANKERLTVIDYIGNHRVFLLKPQALFNLPSGDLEILNLMERVRSGDLEMPPGCEVTYELETVDIIRGLLRGVSGVTAGARFYDDFVALHGVRPTAAEMHQEGYSPRAVGAVSGGWLGFVQARGGLTAEQRRAFARHREFLVSLDTTPMSKSYKMTVILGMLRTNQFPGEIGIEALAESVAWVAGRTVRAAADLGAALHDPGELMRLLERNPIDAWVRGTGTDGVSYFRYEHRMFATKFHVEDEDRVALQELVRELAEWRLAAYLDRPGPAEGTSYVLRVSHANGKPVMFLPTDRAGLPTGWTNLRIGKAVYEANFVKVAVNVVRRPGVEGNELPRLLREWFGPDAGLPGTRHQVILVHDDEGWDLSAPTGSTVTGLKRWRSYSREQIPVAFGMEFSTAIWNVGYVRRSGHIFLLVTLDKSGHSAEFQYGDRFLGRTEFQWQSQNRTSQASKDGQEIRNHVSRGVPVHLFVRAQKKRAGGGSAPFMYCGDVTFLRWSGERPVTVVWQLEESVPDPVWTQLAPEGE